MSRLQYMASRLTLVILLAILVHPGAYAQDNTQPVSKAEVLAALKKDQTTRVEQGELAAQINNRGVNFELNDVVVEELKKAGARSFLIESIKQAIEDGKRPRLKTPEETAQAAQTPETLTPEQRAKLPLLDQARLHAYEFIEGLPNFLVTEIVTRYVRKPTSKDWEKEDKLEIALSYREKEGEKFKLLKINDRPSSQSYENIDGTTSTGEFGTMLAGLFSQHSQASFKEVKRETYKGHQTVVYEFAVKKANSTNQIVDKSTGKSVITAYSGSIWIDAQSGYVVRMESSSEDIQRGFPITMAESAVEYETVSIGGEKYIMPVYAEVILGRDAQRFYSRNVIELKNYRVFDTDVKVILEKDPDK